ncbi:MAG: NAD(P)/FAD-dependent oxidoreductase [Actinomycetota bacterium]|nr:NAD(P)/FAD-dependent oxidoreductase [Actinomycetota bacterium]
MAPNSCDVVVVGLGPGGESAATRLAEGGMSVVGIDERLVGGECPYFGCIPSKMMIRASNVLAEGGRIPELAGAARVAPDWTPVATRIRDEATDDWDDQVAVDRLVKAGVRFVRGHGRLSAPGRVRVGEDEYEASVGVLLNTGTAPAAPPIEGLAETPYWTNRDVLRIEELPASVIVIGGGAIGAEIAQALSRFHVRVTLLEVADRILPPEEPEASALVARVLAGEGIQVLTGVHIDSVQYADGQFTIELDDAQLSAEKLLVAAGRRPNLADIGLDTVGLDPAARALEVDERMRAGEKLWAIGDITGKGAFTHVSMYQSEVAVADILGHDGPTADYRAVSRVTFTDPEVGSVGMSEQQARETGVDVLTGCADGSTSSRGWIHKAGNDGLVKLVADADRGVLVGATSVGPMGGEVLSMLTLAVHAEVPLEVLRRMHYAYPTFHRGMLDALADLASG